MEPIRLYQTDADGIWIPQAIVYSQVFGEGEAQQQLYPAGTRTKEPPALGPNQAARTAGPGRDDPWEIVPDFNGLTYWLPDGSQHTISAVGVEPPEGFLTAPPPPTPAQMQAAIGQAVMDKLNALAKSWRYTNYISARSYIGDTNPKYAAEATAIANYGSACFRVLDKLEAGVLEGTVTMPTTVEAVLALLPPEPARPSIGG